MKDATVSARVEYDVKNEAEAILQQLGIPASVVINSLYRQIIYRHGVPFPLTLPSIPETADEMTSERLSVKLAHSYEQSKAKQGRAYQDVFADLEQELP